MPKTKGSPIIVTAFAKGYYGDVMRMPGDRFEIADASQFSFRWMQTDDPAVLDMPGLPVDYEERAKAAVPVGEDGQTEAQRFIAHDLSSYR